jgi:hypothetical protein
MKRWITTGLAISLSMLGAVPSWARGGFGGFGGLRGGSGFGGDFGVFRSSGGFGDRFDSGSFDRSQDGFSRGNVMPQSGWGHRFEGGDFSRFNDLDRNNVTQFNYLNRQNINSFDPQRNTDLYNMPVTVNNDFNRNVNVDGAAYGHPYGTYDHPYTYGAYPRPYGAAAWPYARPAWTIGADWAAARPWNYGWYRGPETWTWYDNSAAAWGAAGLATGALIGSTVTTASKNNQSYIVVPNTTYQLDYGTVQPYDYTNITFNYSNRGQGFTVNANCQQGLLNGQVPSTPQQAQLLNAACQVAFGGFKS